MSCKFFSLSTYDYIRNTCLHQNDERELVTYLSVLQLLHDESHPSHSSITDPLPTSLLLLVLATLLRCYYCCYCCYLLLLSLLLFLATVVTTVVTCYFVVTCCKTFPAPLSGKNSSPSTCYLLAPLIQQLGIVCRQQIFSDTVSIILLCYRYFACRH